MKKVLSILLLISLNSVAQNGIDQTKLLREGFYGKRIARMWIDTAAFIAFNGNRPITGSIGTGINPAANDVISLLNNLFYPSQVPTASLTGGQQLELIASGSPVSYSLNYTAGRQSATVPIQSIVVAGNTQSFTQPSAPGMVSGTQLVTVARNVNTTFTNTVTTTDSKTSSASTSFTFSPKFYYGFVPSTTPSSSDVIAMSGVFYGGGSYSDNVPGPGAAGYPCFAKPVNTGVFGSIIINTFLQPTSNYSITTKFITNASGYTQNYYVLVFGTTTGGGYLFTAN